MTSHFLQFVFILFSSIPSSKLVMRRHQDAFRIWILSLGNRSALVTDGTCIPSRDLNAMITDLHLRHTFSAILRIVLLPCLVYSQRRSNRIPNHTFLLPIRLIFCYFRGWLTGFSFILIDRDHRFDNRQAYSV